MYQPYIPQIYSVKITFCTIIILACYGFVYSFAWNTLFASDNRWCFVFNKDMVDEDSENSYQERTRTKQPSFQWGRNKAVQNPEEQTNALENFRVPPDGGCRAYVIVIASFCINGFIFGIMNSYSIIYVVLLKKLQSQNVDEAEMKACKFIFIFKILDLF